MSLLDDVRDHVGNQPDDATVLDFLDRYAAVTEPAARAALSILRRRRANLDADRSFAVAGDASWGAVSVEGLRALDAKIARLEGVVGEIAPSRLPALTSVPILNGHDSMATLGECGTDLRW